MRRVYALYVLRFAMRPATRLFMLAGATLGIISLVSVQNIALNALSSSSSAGNLMRYAAHAFVSTEVTVQLLTLLIAFAIALFFRDAYTLVLSREMFPHLMRT